MIFDCSRSAHTTHEGLKKKEHTVFTLSLPLKLGQPARFAARRSLDGVINSQSTELFPPCPPRRPALLPSLILSLGTAVHPETKKRRQPTTPFVRKRPKTKSQDRRKAKAKRDKARTHGRARKEAREFGSSRRRTTSKGTKP